MQTTLLPSFLNTPVGEEADAILRSCVHCGFCTATCPTYQLLGDELDSPRGRIYLIKQVLEGEPVTQRTQRHLDRCLTCRSCETTCPSGVNYSRLLDIGRVVVESKVRRQPLAGLMRWGLRQVLPYPKRFKILLGLARLIRPLLPAKMKQKLP
ncbi:MAG: 4Fe-4S dicluster domain-containing protein, partial [Sedimenticola sp.]|nr:4Fe-4S dicluster domain-containing protein [Sedimenticola sp.]MCW9021984.1 4Fe-4S dicluster domain-containing protein [Sedimenticola sp.]